MKSLLLATLLLALIPHEYHVSIFEIEVTDSSLRMTQKLFVDDFEKALQQEGREIHIGDDLNEKDISEAMQAYVLKHFFIKADQSALELNYVGAEWDEDLHTIYLFWEAKLESMPAHLTIKNDIFMELSTDQENMHHLLWGDENYSFVFKNGEILKEITKSK